jgi:hypothetical protein
MVIAGRNPEHTRGFQRHAQYAIFTTLTSVYRVRLQVESRAPSLRLKVRSSPLGRITPKLWTWHRAQPRAYRPFGKSQLVGIAGAPWRPLELPRYAPGDAPMKCRQTRAYQLAVSLLCIFVLDGRALRTFVHEFSPLSHFVTIRPVADGGVNDGACSTGFAAVRVTGPFSEMPAYHSRFALAAQRCQCWKAPGDPRELLRDIPNNPFPIVLPRGLRSRILLGLVRFPD